MKIKTSELIRHALNWAVAKCEGHIRPDGGTYAGKWQGRVYNPSTDWSQGGPIIDRERISVISHKPYPEWGAHKDKRQKRIVQLGSTALIAAMRVYVASKLGDEVEVPDELA